MAGHAPQVGRVGAAPEVRFPAFQRAELANGLKIVLAESGSITEKALAVGQIQPRQKFQVKSKISGIECTSRRAAPVLRTAIGFRSAS